MVETAVPRIVPTVGTGGSVDLSRPHFVGVGGAGMLPVARVCVERGYAVSGTDVRASAGLDALAGRGADVAVGHSAGRVPAGATAVVFTHAVPEDNPEIAEARRRGIPVVHRSAALNALMEGSKRICVLGTHGKSSTAGMLVHALTGAGRDVSYVVGADLAEAGSGGHAGGGPLFVAEVDESDRTLIGTWMDVAVITGIGFDHPENYAGPGDYIDAFEECVLRGMSADGTLVLNAESAGCRELASRLAARGSGPLVRTYGFTHSAHWRMRNAETADGRSTGVLYVHGDGGVPVRLRVPGVHQVLNAAGALAAMHVCGLGVESAAAGLSTFDGVRRRMTPAGEYDGVRVYDSFAHHPKEVSSDLAAARTLLTSGGRVVAVFQPSGHRRLECFGPALAKALGVADEVVLTDTAAGLPAGSLTELASDVRKSGAAVHMEQDRARAVARAARAARRGDVTVLMGTGDIAEAAPAFLLAVR
jgi:UDP-N-acetylmuramate--alanine ligase